MTWNSTCFALAPLLLLLQGCGIYSFSGISLPPEAKTFSLRYQSNVALGPPDLLEKFQQQLGDELAQRTPLKQVTSQGDLQLEGTIKQFSYTPIAPSKGSGAEQANLDRLTIKIQMNYINPYDEEAAFSKKIFSQYADMPAEASRDQQEPLLIDEIFTKLIKDIFNATVASW